MSNLSKNGTRKEGQGFTYSVTKEEDNDLGPIATLHKITVEKSKFGLGKIFCHAE
jgi:hypothetical protein